MLISLDKNKWLYDWMQDRWENELVTGLRLLDDMVPRPNTMRQNIASMLNRKGYKTKLTRNYDVIIAMNEQEFVFLKLKYS